MKKQIRLLILAVTVVVLVVAYFIYDHFRPRCDAIFEQTAARVGGNVELIKSKGEFFIGRERVQELAEGPQKVALHLKACCVAQQSGMMPPDKFQGCIDGAKDYEYKILQVTNFITEAQAAKDQGNTQLAEQKATQASEAATAATTHVAELGNQVTSPPSVPPPQTSTGIKGAEHEPNNTILEANIAEMGAIIAGEIAPQDDQDFYKFQYRDSRNRRDIIAVHLENQSPTLQPSVRLHNEDKSVFGGSTSANAAGANLDVSFSAEPGKTYYLAVSSAYGSSVGKYTLSVTPQKAYDQYEPNNDAFTATAITLGQAVEANIMDSADVDWYRLSGAKEKTVTVHLENESQTLQPSIEVRNADKSVLQGWTSANAQGADLEVAFPTEPGKEYYLVVAPAYGNSAGKYKLSTR